MEKFGLNWENKKEKIVEQILDEIPIFEEKKSKSIILDKNKNSNFIIEGDNYHALSTLNFTHKGEVDLIYIDPPYNTGQGEAFMFDDRTVQKEDTYRHSKWISFMNNRLVLARKLLKDTGFIFISINDVEFAQLKLLCNEIFLESNFVATFIWKTRQNVDSRSLTGASIDHEYILCYRKSSKAKLRGKNINKEKYKNPDKDPRGDWMSSPMDGVATKDRRPNLHYDIVNPKNGKKYKASKSSGWRFEKSTLAKLIKEKRIIWPKNPNSKPRFKRYVKELLSDFTGFSSILETEFTAYGTRQLREIFNSEEKFKFPKPSPLISNLIEQCSNKSALILDFFAGSGTTGQAVLELNKKDNGNRKFILCTTNENKIAEEVCYERLARVIKGYSFEKLKIGGIKSNLRYFKISFVNSKNTDPNKINIFKKLKDTLCFKEDIFEMDKKGKNFEIYKNSSSSLAVIYNHEEISKIKQMIKKGKQFYKIYIFSLQGDSYDEEFDEVSDKCIVHSLPAELLRNYSI